MNDSMSYCTREMAASQSRTVHYKTHRVCSIHTTNIGPISPLSSTKQSPCIEPLSDGRSDILLMIQRATVPGNGCVPITHGTLPEPQGLFYPHKKYWPHWTHYAVLDHHIESNPCSTRRSDMYWIIQRATVPGNGCGLITRITSQDPQGLFYPHKKYWTHRPINQY